MISHQSTLQVRNSICHYKYSAARRMKQQNKQTNTHSLLYAWVPALSVHNQPLCGRFLVLYILALPGTRTGLLKGEGCRNCERDGAVDVEVFAEAGVEDCDLDSTCIGRTWLSWKCTIMRKEVGSDPSLPLSIKLDDLQWRFGCFPVIPLHPLSCSWINNTFRDKFQV